MSEHEDEVLSKAKKRVEIADRFRLTFLGIAFVMLLFLFFGAKVWEAKVWFEQATPILYTVLTYDVVMMLACTIIKMMLAMKYNQILKLK